MATIVVVEDEGPVRELLAIVLRDAGYRVLTAANGKAALTHIARESPDLVLADIMMPVLGGVALCQRLKADDATRSIPVILMSAAGPRAADGAGADAYLDKPFDLDDVEALVARLLRSRD